MDIAKGNIGNALHSVAPEHVVATAFEVYDETMSLYQDEINQTISTGYQQLSQSFSTSLATVSSSISGTLAATSNSLSQSISTNLSASNAALNDYSSSVGATIEKVRTSSGSWDNVAIWVGGNSASLSVATGSAKAVSAITASLIASAALAKNLTSISASLKSSASVAAEANSWITANSASISTATGSSHSHSNKTLLDSLTNAKTGSWDTAATNSHTHSNKSVLDGITAERTASWDNKGEGVLTSVTVRSGSAYLSGDTTITSSGEALLDLSAATKGKVESGSTAFSWGNHANAGYVTSSGVTNVTLKAISPIAIDDSASITDTGTRTISVASGYSIPTNTLTASLVASASLAKSAIQPEATSSWTNASTWVESNSASIDTATGSAKAISALTASLVASASVAETAQTWITANSGTIASATGSAHSHSNKAILDTWTSQELVSLPSASTGATSGTITLESGKFTKCGTLTGTVTFRLGSTVGSSRQDIYAGNFKMGETVYTVNWPADIAWAEGTPSTDKANSTYEFNFCDGVGVLIRTS